MSKIDIDSLKRVGICAIFALAVLASALLLIAGIYIKNMGACVVGGIVLAFCLCGAVKWFSNKSTKKIINSLLIF